MYLTLCSSGIEPEFTVWKTAILPLNYECWELFGGASNKLKRGLTGSRTQASGEIY